MLKKKVSTLTMNSHYDPQLLKSDRFIGEEDIDLSKLSPEEYYAEYMEWLKMAQSTNDQDADEYSHGVFMLMKEPGRKLPGKNQAEKKSEYQ